jgi:RNA polymerase sigma-70 factor (ECF subfamily)
MASIDEIIRQSAPGDPRLYEALMVDYYNTIYRLTNAILQDSDEADDVTQETFIQAAAHISDYQPGTKLKSWLSKIAVNICRDKHRRWRTHQRLLNALKLLLWQARQISPSPEEAAISGERRRVIRSVIENLDEKHRLPIFLRYVQGMSIAEIAEVLEIQEGTVHSRLHYAHLRLRERLEADQEQAFSRESFE